MVRARISVTVRSQKMNWPVDNGANGSDVVFHRS